MRILFAVVLLSLLPTQAAYAGEPRFQLVARSCGLEPVAPKGCQVNSCVCDSVGTNCHWIMYCGFCCRYDSYIQPIDPRLPHYGNILDGFPGRRPPSRFDHYGY